MKKTLGLVKANKTLHKNLLYSDYFWDIILKFQRILSIHEKVNFLLTDNNNVYYDVLIYLIYVYMLHM